MKGQLFLIPTPIGVGQVLDAHTFQILSKASLKNQEMASAPRSLFLIETPKSGRAQWVSYGLPREEVPHLIPFNEQTHSELLLELVQKLLQGHDLYLMSDGGMPAFMDPGQDLVLECRKNDIHVRAGFFSNSVILALALSGLGHRQFYFDGNLPRETEERNRLLKKFWEQKETIVLLDTPYRLPKLLESLEAMQTLGAKNRMIYIGLDLQSPSEFHFFGRASQLSEFRKKLTEKHEWIVVLGSI